MIASVLSSNYDAAFYNSSAECENRVAFVELLLAHRDIHVNLRNKVSYLTTFKYVVNSLDVLNL